ncbi:MAG TPA: heme ABC transporter ATP-binding protein [Kiritimatiellia bacterium]|nr:heme ABC transporter ATP-binding protein [Kiritimatiellia bacterium]HMO98365.1 heme ABC transporter ATP-binding protein [Kiritimatiellia bacterium]HMP97645.1 heme ABC transporter ATP-binding protein [Kiritimatiellia bacterium]
MIRLEHVSVVRSGRRILNSLDLTLADGGVTVVLGANGAGKSSIVRLISGEWRPDEGEVWWGNTRLSRMPRMELARRRAVVSQHHHHGFAFRVLDLVLLGRLPHTGQPEHDHLAIAGAALEHVGLADFADRSINTLSGGERQRVHLARALAQLHEARAEGRGLLVLDEPTAHLDLARQHHFLQLAHDLAHEGLAVVVVLHDLHAAADIADHIALLRGGRLLAYGSAEHVLTPALLSDAYTCRIERVRDDAGRLFFIPHRHPQPALERIQP